MHKQGLIDQDSSDQLKAEMITFFYNGVLMWSIKWELCLRVTKYLQQQPGSVLFFAKQRSQILTKVNTETVAWTEIFLWVARDTSSHVIEKFVGYITTQDKKCC